MTTRKTFTILSVGSLALAMSTAANAQTLESADIIPLEDWTAEGGFSDGHSIQAFLDDVEVYDAGGEEIGDIENVLFDPDGRVLSIIAEVGGFWDIGDTHVNVPWSDVEMRPDMQSVTIPVTEETVDAYTVYPDEMISRDEVATTIEAVDDDPVIGPRVWRATELIGDYARLREGDANINYGYVDDIIVRDGQIAAVLVRPSASFRTPGVYGYPFYGYAHGWGAGMPNYDLPYVREDTEALEPVDETSTE